MGHIVTTKALTQVSWHHPPRATFYSARGYSAGRSNFALGSPEVCSDLNVMDLSPASLQLKFGDDFDLGADLREPHHTRLNAEQNFIYYHFRRRR